MTNGGIRAGQQGAFVVALGFRAREACKEILEKRNIRVVTYDDAQDAIADLAWMSPSLLFIPARDESMWRDVLLNRSDDGLGPVDILPDMVCLSTVPEYLWRGGGCDPLRDLLGDPDGGSRAGPVAARLLEPVMEHEVIPVVETLLESRRLRRRRLARQRLDEPYLGALQVIASKSRFAVLVNAARLVDQLTGISRQAFLRLGQRGWFVEQVFGVPKRRLHRVVASLERIQWESLPEESWVEIKSEVGKSGGQGIDWVYQMRISGPVQMRMVLFAKRVSGWSEGEKSDMRLVAEHVGLGLAGAGANQEEDRRRDPWTGLPGKMHFRSMVKSFFDSGARRIRVLCVDVEGFSEFNRRFGHLAGAYLVTQVASRLVRAGADFVGRAGADSFLMAVAGRASEPPDRIESFVSSSLSFDLRKVPGLVDGRGGKSPPGGWIVPIRLQIRTGVVLAGEDVDAFVNGLTDITCGQNRRG